MTILNRSEFLKFGLLALTTGLVNRKAVSNGIVAPDKTNGGNTPMIHATDLYHVHNDPDDHWDLATIYALGYSGEIDLRGILFDYPSRSGLGDPDVMGVAQMNYYSGLVVPSVVGTPFAMTTRDDTQTQATNIELQGVNWLLETLRKSHSPVVINIVGAATNVAVALKMDPTLFKKKCKAIYLNAGSANSLTDKKLEYNVKLNPSAYAAIFDATCPVYWMPCMTRTNIMEVGEYGTYYSFIQKEILPDLPVKLQNFFLFMFGQKKNHEWFSYLNGTPEDDLLTQFSNSLRRMWCTAGFIHAAGNKVTAEGEIVPLNSKKESVFSFLPVKTSCNDLGFVDWKLDNTVKNRYIFHVNNMADYSTAMTIAMKQLLLQLPK
jgi:hypothetical protein